MESLFNGLYIVVMIVVLLGISIFIHEFGHFIAARLCGMVIDAFSIGFGPAVWKRKVKGITYKIGLIPGGYVALPQLDPSGMQVIQGDNAAPATPQAPEGSERRLPPVKPWQKIIVALSGALGNILLAVALAFIVYYVDKPASSMGGGGAIIGDVAEDSPAYAAGLRPGDLIIAVDGKAVRIWQEFMQLGAMAEKISVRVRSGADNTVREVVLPTKNNPTIGLLMVEGIEEGSICKVRMAQPGTSAALAGVKSGDIIRKFDGVRVASRSHLIRMVKEHVDREVPMTVERGGRQVELRVTPVFDKKFEMVRIGIEFDPMVSKPLDQLAYDATAIFRILKALVTPGSSQNAAKGLGGPISILGMFGLYLSISLIHALAFTRFLNVNLAILNLLPLPVLDGGHIVFSLWEWIMRRPVHPKVVTWLVNIFAGLIILAMVLLTYRDIIRWWLIGREIGKARDAAAVVEKSAATNAAAADAPAR